MAGINVKNMLLAVMVIIAVLYASSVGASSRPIDRSSNHVASLDPTRKPLALPTTPNRKLLSLAAYAPDVMAHSRDLAGYSCKGKCDDHDDKKKKKKHDDNDKDKHKYKVYYKKDDDHKKKDDDDKKYKKVVYKKHDDDDKKTKKHGYYSKSFLRKFYTRFFKKSYKKHNYKHYG